MGKLWNECEGSLMELEFLGAMKDGVQVNRIHLHLKALGSSMNKPTKNR